MPHIDFFLLLNSDETHIEAAAQQTVLNCVPAVQLLTDSRSTTALCQYKERDSIDFSVRSYYTCPVHPCLHVCLLVLKCLVVLLRPE